MSTETEFVKAALKANEPGPTGNADAPVIAVTKKDAPDEPVIPDTLSVLPVRGMVVFPGTVVPLSIRRGRLAQDAG